MRGKLKVKKQSLIDWSIEDDLYKTFAWIHKVKLGYEVDFVSDPDRFKFFKPSFAEAKAFALEHAGD